jgi:prephenate dehydrogenase
VRVAIIGFGLIGGSMARALRRPGAAPLGGERPSIAAWSPSRAGPLAALTDGSVDAAPAALAETLEGADLVVLAGPPMACLALLDDLGGSESRRRLGSDAVITDVASTKVRIVERAASLGLRFVGGHPMAGGETAGYGAADATLFEDRPWVVVPPDLADPGATTRVDELAIACGARPVHLAAVDHDAAVAAISHLPLVLSASLVEAVVDGPDWPRARALAASGWRDMARLARGDVAMGAGILATNAVPLAEAIRRVGDRLDAWLADLEGDPPDFDRLAARLEAARDRLDRP